MIKKVVSILLILIGIYSFAQQSSYDEVNCKTLYKNIAFKAEAGLFIPLDQLKNTLGPSPQIGLYFGSNDQNRYRFELGFSIFIPVNTKKVEYLLPDTTVTGNPSLSGTMGIWLNRSHDIGKCWFIDAKIGSGLGFFQTDIPTNKPEDENDSVYGAETVFINLGVGARRKVFNGQSIGLTLNYFFVPYNAFEKNLNSDFGNQYLNLSTYFMF